MKIKIERTLSNKTKTEISKNLKTDKDIKEFVELLENLCEGQSLELYCND